MGQTEVKMGKSWNAFQSKKKKWFTKHHQAISFPVNSWSPLERPQDTSYGKLNLEKIQADMIRVRELNWLVVEPYPSEKWWSSSAGMMTFPNWMESHKIHLTYMDYQYMIGFLIYNRHPITLYHWIFQMFQSPPTSFRTNKPILRFVDLDFTREKCWDVRRKSAPSPSPSAGEGQSGGRLCQWPG